MTTPNMETLLKRAEAIGSDTIPVSNGNSPEIQEALMAIFEKHPTSWFRSKDLAKALEDADYKCKKIGDVLFAMKNAGKIVRPVQGIYGLDKNKTASTVGKTADSVPTSESD